MRWVVCDFGCWVIALYRRIDVLDCARFCLLAGMIICGYCCWFGTWLGLVGCDCGLGVVTMIVSGLDCCLFVRLLAATLGLFAGYLVLIRCDCLQVGYLVALFWVLRCCFDIGFHLACWCWVCVVGGVATLDVGVFALQIW